jgi:polysaccharide export outer membrane protein
MRFLRMAALVVAGMGTVASPAFAEYKLQPGDTLEISVTGIQGLRQRSLIGLEGEISLPLDGQMKVSGLTVREVRAILAQRLANKVYRQSGGEQQDVSHLIVPDEVVVTVAEYRPIYVNGDVVKPGEYAFRPGMTVRQAVAVAGGYGLARLGMVDPHLQAADLAAEYETLSTQLASEQAQAWRLRAELSASGSNPVVDGASSLPAVSQIFVQGQTQQYQARVADRDQDATFLRTAISKADLQLKVLADRRNEIEAGYQADLSDFEKLKQLSTGGLTTVARLSDTRRVVLLSSGQLLQTAVDISNIERQRSDYVRQLDKLSGQNRIDDLKELQSVELRIAEITSGLKSVRNKMAYLGLAKPQLADDKAPQPSITVHRVTEGSTQDLAGADNDLALTPGDVIDVSMPADRTAKLTPLTSGALSTGDALSTRQ